MSVYTLDFETYYDKEYSLTKMSTEAYIKDPRFDVILVGIKKDNEPPTWFSGPKRQTKEWLEQFPLRTSGVIGHNMMFDATILQEYFGIRPGLIIDTISMAQAALKPFIPRVGLKYCLEYLQLGIEKGTEVHNMLGRTRQSLSRAELQKYAEYCMDDCEGEYRLYEHLKGMFPKSEFAIMDLTHRMYLDPVLELDTDLLAELLAEERVKKQRMLQSVSHLGEKADLMSNAKFAEMLKSLGIDPPMKKSPTTGKPTFAFAKSDQGFKELEEEYADNEVVSALLMARLGIKSTIMETRLERLLEIGLNYKKLRVPLNYYAAHTGRYGGTQKINLQNPPRVEKSRLRYAIRAPKDYVVLGADLSQIEARIVAWWAGQKDLVEDFRIGADVYSKFATTAYKIETIKKRSTADDQRRFVGKTCILGLGFGMGAPKLKTSLFKDGVKIDQNKAFELVNTYRGVYSKIPQLWARLDNALSSMAQGYRGSFGPIQFGKNMGLLPNGMPLVYNKLRREDGGGGWIYNFGAEVRTLWGGKVAENFVQAMARIIVMDNALTIKRELGLDFKLQVHDELDYVVLARDAEQYSRAISEIMSVPPSWAPDLPVAVEVNYGPTFGDCK